MPRPTTRAIVYPESDGEPMGENTLQVKWIVNLMNGLSLYSRDRPDVLVAADLFWYPVEGRPGIVTAPDLMVAVGRPKGDRPSYKQWEEGGVAPQVVFGVFSPSNTLRQRGKLGKFYARYGVEEFYEYDPETRELTMRLREGKRLGRMVSAVGHTSARLGVRFEVPPGGELRVIGPDGKPLRTHFELADEAVAALELVVEERRKAAEAERKAAEEQRKAGEAEARLAEMAARLRELGIDPDRR